MSDKSKKGTKNDSLVFKIITLGDSGVGKTSIIRRYVYNIFDDNSISTIGLAFSFKDIKLKNKKNVQIKLIDTGGQEKYRALAKTYFKNADAVLFVFGLDDEKSYENMTEWIKSFNENHNGKEGIPLYLIGNKSDLERIVDKNLIEEFAKNNNLCYKETSAKENISINELFEEIAEKLYNEYVKSGRKNKSQNTIKMAHNKAPKKKGCCIFGPDIVQPNEKFD